MPNRIGIDVVYIDDLSMTPSRLAKYIDPEVVDDDEIVMWRYSYWMERCLFNRLKVREKAEKDLTFFSDIRKYYFDITSGIFFTENIVERLDQLYGAFRKYPRLSARCGCELEGVEFDDDASNLPESLFKKTFYDCKYTDIQISSYVEHVARLAILKTAVDYKLYEGAGATHKTKSDFKILGLSVDLKRLLPSSFKDGLSELSSHAYYQRYPVFWQYFLWLFGGFILKDYIDEEYDLLSKKTGIPVEEIPNAMRAFDILFPTPSGWFQNCGSDTSNITVLKMFPIPFRGIGANYRRRKHSKKRTYQDLELTGSYTRKDLVKWNNLAVEVLET